MKQEEIIACLNNGLYVAALRHVFKELNLPDFPDLILTIEDCLNGIKRPATLIIQKECLPNPIAYSLERIHHKNPDCHIVMLDAEKIEPEAMIYCRTQIFSTETEHTIVEKLKAALGDGTKNEPEESSDTSLSDREVDVVQLVAVGKTNKEISEELNISTHTVITHRKNITSKLGIKTIAGLVVYAVLNGLIDPEEVNG